MRCWTRTVALLTAAAALWLGAPTSVHAFCGFYVGSAESELVNEATMVVLLRDGTKTVLSMQNDYQGPPEDFALVVPVPVVLQESDVRVLPRRVFQTVERLAAPRLVEYWERDPCEPQHPGGIGLGNLGTIGRGAGGGGYGRGMGGLVTVEAQFEVGEYDIVILSARDSGALDAWLRQNGYRIPEGAGDVLRPYVESEMKFFVAKVNVERVTFEGGRAVLSPLRVHYDSEEFSLPVRLGLLNSRGAQDLVVHVLARSQRYEVANYENVTIPTNLDVTDATRARFGEFYAALFDTVVAQHPRSVVTEYSWQATNCDPCPGPVLSTRDILTLGGDLLVPGGTAQVSSSQATTPAVARVRSAAPQVMGSLSSEVVRRVVRRHRNELRFCYDQARARSPDVQGRVTFRAIIDGAGRVSAASVLSDELGDEGATTCMTDAWKRWRFPAPDGGGVVAVTYPFVFSTQQRGGGRLGFGRATGGGFMDMVLTRLHYRYGRDDLGEDLVFRPAPPIVGGREHRRGGARSRRAPRRPGRTTSRRATRSGTSGRGRSSATTRSAVAGEVPRRGRPARAARPPRRTRPGRRAGRRR